MVRWMRLGRAGAATPIREGSSQETSSALAASCRGSETQKEDRPETGSRSMRKRPGVPAAGRSAASRGRSGSREANTVSP